MAGVERGYFTDPHLEPRTELCGSWAAVVTRALRFIRKRRRIAIAWSNYRNHQLRHLPLARETEPARPRETEAEQVRPLQEGPAISHGSLRRRA